MPATPPPDGTARPTAAQINEQIRALSAGKAVWTDAARAEWVRLTQEWNSAKRAEDAALAA